MIEQGAQLATALSVIEQGAQRPPVEITTVRLDTEVLDH